MAGTGLQSHTARTHVAQEPAAGWGQVASLWVRTFHEMPRVQDEGGAPNTGFPGLPEGQHLGAISLSLVIELPLVLYRFQ